MLFFPRSTLIAVLCTIPLLAACGSETSPESALEQRAAPIINGERESGWEGVGALTNYYEGYGYVGSFCSGTLIAPDWVLTAAHCISGGGRTTSPADGVMFYIGQDARATHGGATPSTGRLYAADVMIAYPGYDPDSRYNNDIGLVHLSEPVTDIEPYDIKRTEMTDDLVGRLLFYVGFGATEGVNSTGGGLKRSTDVPLAIVGPTTYSSGYEGHGVCFGDSGGPGFLEEEDGVWRVAGVNSSVGGGGEDPCRGTSVQTRVDTYAVWIDGYLEGGAPTCLDIPDMCVCPDACQPDGSCDNTVCEVFSCRAISVCTSNCSHGDYRCYQNCTEVGTPDARQQLNALWNCVWQNCSGMPNEEAYQQCLDDNCQSQIDACYALATGDGPCNELLPCLDRCPPGTSNSAENCRALCLERSTAEAQQSYDAIIACGTESCGEDRWADADAWDACMIENCAALYDECAAPSGCALTGGDCAEGTACRTLPTGSTDCRPSKGAVFGASCTPPYGEPVPCADGLVCVAGEDGLPSCAQLCIDADGCPGGGECDQEAFAADEALGLCACVDEDGDGFCLGGDCDDSAEAVFPGAAEVCENEVDDDCDGATDEDCPVCEDADDDGFCADEDCDDEVAAINPDAEELCGDDIDNDCDGETDETCPVDEGPGDDIGGGADAGSTGDDTAGTSDIGTDDGSSAGTDSQNAGADAQGSTDTGSGGDGGGGGGGGGCAAGFGHGSAGAPIVLLALLFAAVLRRRRAVIL